MSDIKSCFSVANVPIKKRIVCNKWTQCYTPEFEWSLLTGMDTDSNMNRTLAEEKLLCSQIQGKRQSYKHQDVVKNKYTADKFISMEQILVLLRDSQLQCLYCRQKCRLLYEQVRDPLQWSLDRLDNTLGHNYDNVCVACLACNLKRRVTQYRNFVLTKHTVLCKLDAKVEK